VRIGAGAQTKHINQVPPMTQPLILVTGGAGFLGINLIRHLLAQGHAIRSMDIAPFDYPERAAIDIHQTDIRDRTAVAHAMREVALVIHCAAALPLASKEDIHTTDVEGTGVLLETAAQFAVDRFIYISSTSVYGIPDHHPLYEHDRLQGVGPYGIAKIAAEQLCMNSRQSGRCIVILRPKSFVGPERLGVFEMLYDWAYAGKNFPVLGSGNNLYQLLDVADLCDLISSCMKLNPDTVNDTFNVAAKVYGTMRDNFQTVLDRAGHGKHVIGLPAKPVIAALELLEYLHLSPLYQWIYATAATESFVSIERAESKLGFAPRYSNRMALVRNYDWYVANRAEALGRTGVTHRVPWKKGALQLAKWFF
jgi:nucleoside-diphosphate-sugar epimerase